MFSLRDMRKQRNIIAFISLLVFLCLRVICYGQQLQNPSFEGITGIAITPQQWQSYGKSSSPDTQPGAWNVYRSANHGGTYMSMVCRGISIIDNYLWEACSQRLTSPLEIGKLYHYSIDLSYSKNFIADTFHFNQPAMLKIWGVNSSGQPKELLWESEKVTANWQTYFFDVQPTQFTETIILEAYYQHFPKYNGNILIDNFQYYPELPTPNEKDTIMHIAIDSVVNVDENYSIVLDENGFPTKIDDRAVKQQREITFTGNHITISVWDNQSVDGDIVSLFLNGKPILTEFTISKEKHLIQLNVEEGTDYYLTLFAHNLGKIPPNTLSLLVSDGKKEKIYSLKLQFKSMQCC